MTPPLTEALGARTNAGHSSPINKFVCLYEREDTAPCHVGLGSREVYSNPEVGVGVQGVQGVWDKGWTPPPPGLDPSPSGLQGLRWTTLSKVLHPPRPDLCVNVLCTCLSVGPYVRTRVCMYVCVYVCMYVCIHVCMCVCQRCHSSFIQRNSYIFNTCLNKKNTIDLSIT